MHRRAQANVELAAEIPPLTDDEGAILALLIRAQPATAYQLLQICAQSPVTNFGTSKGKVYPLIRRLKSKGLVASQPISGDARGSEWLVSTDFGTEAVRCWIRGIKPTHLLPEDAFRTRLQSFHLLSNDEQWDWLSNAETFLKRKLGELLTNPGSFTGPYNDLVRDNAITSIRSRLEWLARIRSRLMREADVAEPVPMLQKSRLRS